MEIIGGAINSTNDIKWFKCGCISNNNTFEKRCKRHSKLSGLVTFKYNTTNIKLIA